MYCFRCGSKVEDNQKYCSHCGADIIEELNRYNYSNTNEQNKETKVHMASHEDQYSYSIKYSFGDDEDLIKIYVGKNYEKIKKANFSLPTFFFGPIYFFYRKLYALGLGYALINIFIGISALPIIIVIRVLLATTFSQLYLNIVKKRIEKIKQQNKNIDKETLKLRCKIKGGVNILVILILIIILFLSIILVITYISEKITNNNIETTEIMQKERSSIGDISYIVPKGFEKNEFRNQKDYDIYTEDGHCSIYFTISEYYNSNETAQEFLNNSIHTNQNDIVSPINSVTINNINLNYLTIQNSSISEYRYATKIKNTIYDIRTINNIENSSCNNYYQQILNSISYKE